LISRHSEIKKSADLWANQRSAFFIFNPNKNAGGEKMKRLFSKKGQGTLEYVIIWTAIVGAILYAGTRFLKPAVQDALEQTSGKITTEVGNLVSGTGQ